MEIFIVGAHSLVQSYLESLFTQKTSYRVPHFSSKWSFKSRFVSFNVHNHTQFFGTTTEADCQKYISGSLIENLIINNIIGVGYFFTKDKDKIS